MILVSKIGIIGYHGVGHLKVLNIANDLVQKNYDISIYAFPFKKNNTASSILLFYLSICPSGPRGLT